MTQPKRRSGKIDWDEIERAYIHSNGDLYTFSREKTKNPKHPTLSTLQAKYYERGWDRLRAARVQQELIEAMGKNSALQAEVVQVELLASESLLNANNAILRHIKLAQDGQLLAASLVPKFQAAIEFLDLNQLAVDNPRGFISALKALMEFVATATELERKALGAADLKVEFTAAINNDSPTTTLEESIKALEAMPQEELIKSYMDSIKRA